MQPAAPATVPVARTVKWDMLLDAAGRLSLDEVLFPTQQGSFTPYDPWFPSRQNGTTWLRLALSTQQNLGEGWFLDTRTAFMGEVPDEPQVWLVPPDSVAGKAIEPAYPGLYPLPEAAAGSLYIRSAGVPGPSFMPLLRSGASLTELDTRFPDATLLFFGSLFLLILLRGLMERREWRLWAALYALGVLAQIFWGLPATPRGVIHLWDIPGLLAPGLALLMLPHVGRHILRTRQYAPFIDLQLILLGMPGLALALVPLVPGYGWTLRYLPLWPLFMLIYVPTLLGSLFKNLPGSRRFLLMCLCPPVALLLGLGLAPLTFMHDNGWLLTLLSLLPWMGLGLSVVLMAFAPTPRWLPLPETQRDRAQGRGSELPRSRSARPSRQEATLSLDPASPLSDSALDLVADTPRESGRPAAGNAAGTRDALSAPVLQGLEGDLREVLDTLFVNIAALDQSGLPPSAKDISTALARSGRKLAGLINDLPRRFQNGEAEPDAPPVHRFDLRELMLQVHNAVAAKAEAKSLGLSWFSAPHLHRYFEGDGLMLYKVLVMLAESAINATQNRGMVQIRAHRLSESNDPGQLVFSIIDSGSGMPPFGRSGMALVRAWELVRATGGSLRMDSTPTGTVITCSLRFKAVSSNLPVTPPAETVAEKAAQDACAPVATDMAPVLRIIVGSDVPANRQLMAYYLDELPHEVLEARSSGEAASLYSRTPGALLVFDGDLPEEDMANAIAAIRTFEGEHTYPPTSIVVLVNDEQQASRLRRAGCTQTLFKPILRTELRHLVLRLAPLPKPRGKTPKPANPPSQTARSTKNGKAASRGGALQNLPDLSLTPKEETPAEAPQEKKLWGLLTPFSGQSKEKKTPARSEKPVELASVASSASSASTASSVSAVSPVSESCGAADAGAPAEPGQRPESALSSSSPTTAKPPRSAFQPSTQQAAPRPLSNVGEPMPIPRSAHTERPTPKDERPARRPVPSIAPARVVLDRNRQDYGPADSVEWVGEPMPIIKKAPAAPETPVVADEPVLPASSNAKTAQSPVTPVFHPVSRPFTAPPDRDEWVGEPMPIIKQTPPAAATPAASEATVATVSSSSVSTTAAFSADDRAEWVGEPMPLRRHSSKLQPVAAETSDKPADQPPSLSQASSEEDLDNQSASDAAPLFMAGTAESAVADLDASAPSNLNLTPSASESRTVSDPPLTMENHRTTVTRTTTRGGFQLIIEPEEPAMDPTPEARASASPLTMAGASPSSDHEAHRPQALTLSSAPLSLLPETAPEAPSSRGSRGPLRLNMDGPGLPDLPGMRDMTPAAPEEPQTIINLTERLDTTAEDAREDAGMDASPLFDAFDPLASFASPSAATTSGAPSFMREPAAALAFMPDEEDESLEPDSLLNAPLSADVKTAAPEEPATPVRHDASAASATDDDPQPEAPQTLNALAEDMARITAAFEDVETGIAAGNPQAVLAAASALSMVAEDLRLHMLAGQARCMEDLAESGDMQALRDFLPELREGVNRQREEM